MAIVFRLDTKGVRGLDGRYARATTHLMNRRREDLRKDARRFIDLLRSEVPVKSGETRESINYRMFIEGSSIIFKVYSSKVTEFLMQGTSAHIIPHGPGPVAFIWENAPFPPNAPDKVHHIFSSVNHPGTKPNRYVGRAYRRWLPGARSTLRKIAASFVREF